MKKISLAGNCGVGYFGSTRRLNYVCADCRVARKDCGSDIACHMCGKEMYCLGERRRVPKKANHIAWRNIKISADHWREKYIKPISVELPGKSPRAEIIKDTERTAKNLIERKMPAKE